MYKMETERCPETVLQQNYLEEDLKEDKPGRSVFRKEENEQKILRDFCITSTPLGTREVQLNSLTSIRCTLDDALCQIETAHIKLFCTLPSIMELFYANKWLVFWFDVITSFL
jgi:hypothetical protein